MLLRTFKYRLYPNKGQRVALEHQLTESCFLYNSAIQERKEAWRLQKITLNYYDQANQLKDIRHAGNLGIANYSVCQDVLRRVDKTFKAFFRRAKTREKAGYPRFKSQNRFDSFTFPIWGNGCHLNGTERLKVQGVGIVKIKMHRPVSGIVKTLTLKKEAGKWYACFNVVVENKTTISLINSIGIDLGLYSFAALSDSQLIPNPCRLKKGLIELKRSQRKVSRRKKRSNNRRKAILLLQKSYIHIRNQRSDFQHKLSRQLANSYGLIAVEDLNIKALSRGMLARSVNDAGWGSFLAKLAYKVEETGGRLVRVNPNGTSQICSRCGCLPNVPKTLADRIHSCPHCGLVIDRDVNAARNILGLGLSLWNKTWEVAPCVFQEATYKTGGVVTPAIARTTNKTEVLK